jgi:hypothetical protein
MVFMTVSIFLMFEILQSLNLFFLVVVVVLVSHNADLERKKKK